VPERHDLEDEIPLLVVDLFEAAGAVRRRSADLGAVVGQSQARWQLLSLVNAEGPWTVPHAARRLGITRQAVQRVANALVRDGLLATRPNPNHKSSPLIELTEEGRRMLGMTQPGASDWRSELAGALTPEDVAAARRVLRVIASG
jgi:DNA-binding MarR family transcriptional regulator